MRKKIEKQTVAVVVAVMLAFTAAPAANAAGRELVPMGNTVGIQMSTDGIIVVGFGTQDEMGGESPAEAAGIRAGDVIVGVGGRSTRTAAEFLAAVSQLDGGDVEIQVLRSGEQKSFNVKPTRSENGTWQLGIWLRDSVSGIGTVTFYDPENGTYGALGHPISDFDTGIIMPVGEGTIMFSTVVDVKPGVSGSPGELCGFFEIDDKIGNISINSESGIFGMLESGQRKETIPVGTAGEIRTGKATILSNVRDTLIEEFEVEITRVYRGEENGRSMMISVTDPKLLQITGGIVQGMSGSPIIQNGKLIGAVTHVLVNDPTRGYGIAIEEMLKMSDALVMPNAA